MSNLVFPSLPGLEWNVVRAPIFSTTKRASVSGRRFAFANYSFPRYKYTMSFSVLRQGGSYTELQQVVGLFNQCYGDFDTFLWTDPDDYTVTAQPFGSGDASTRSFQLVRTWGGFVEPVYATNGAPQIYLAGVLKTVGTDYTISASGLVTFTVAPGSGVALTWSGQYYRRVNFSQSTLEFNKFLQNLWELKKLEFESWRP
jgi:uncharacterized protein (TIGR02217 family)